VSDRKLELSEWYPQAAGLSVGQRRRGDHDCGDPGSLLLSRDDTGYMAYCFRCGGRGTKKEQESQEKRIARLAHEENADSNARLSVELPTPRVYTLREWPQAAALWFYKMGLSPSKIAELRMYWCPDMGRVVLPIFEADQPVYWTARSHTRTPKWIGPRLPKDGLAAKFAVGKGDTVVLCEDPLSAYKVSSVTESWSLLGTKLHSRHIAELMAARKRVAVWLDDDVGRRGGKNPGQQAAREIIARLRAVGLEVRNVKSERDPKYYNHNYIEEALHVRVSVVS
jgi:hypothetical protein